MNQNLTPTPIVDKNGRLTTVHKKVDVVPSTGVRVPPPIVAIPEQPSKKKLVGKLADMMDDVLQFDDPEQKDWIIESLDEHSVEFLERLDRIGPSWLTAQLVSEYEPEVMINEVLAFVDEVKADSTPEAITLIRSLHSYPQLEKHHDYSLAPKEVKDQAVKLLRVCEAMRCHADDSYERGIRVLLDTELDNTRNTSTDMSCVMKDERMINAILEDPDFADRAIDVIKERRTAHYDTIVAVLNHEQTALTRGVL